MMKKQTKNRPISGCTATHLAKMTGLSQRSVQRLATDGVLVKISRGRYDEEASLAAMVRYYRPAVMEQVGDRYAEARAADKEELALTRRAKRERLGSTLQNATEARTGLAKYVQIIDQLAGNLANEVQKAVPDLPDEVFIAIEKISHRMLAAGKVARVTKNITPDKAK